MCCKNKELNEGNLSQCQKNFHNLNQSKFQKFSNKAFQTLVCYLGQTPLPCLMVLFASRIQYINALYRRDRTFCLLLSLLSRLPSYASSASNKESACQCRQKRRGFSPWVGKTPWRRAWQPTPVFLPGESHGQRSLVSYSPQVPTESDMTEVTQHTRMYNSVGRNPPSPTLSSICFFTDFLMIAMLAYAVLICISLHGVAKSRTRLRDFQ